MEQEDREEGNELQMLLQEINRRFRTKEALYAYLVEKTVSTNNIAAHSFL